MKRLTSGNITGYEKNHADTNRAGLSDPFYGYGGQPKRTAGRIFINVISFILVSAMFAMLVYSMMFTGAEPGAFLSGFVTSIASYDYGGTDIDIPGALLAMFFPSAGEYTDILDESETPPVILKDKNKTLEDLLEEYGNTYETDPGELDKGYFPIVKADISNQNDVKKVLLRNSSGYKIDEAYIQSRINGEYPVKASKSETGPLVLIVHTHTTESYVPESVNAYLPSNAVAETRSRDSGANIVAVGRTIKNVLKQMGIGVIHCEDYHDIYVFKDSYKHSGNTVKEYLDKYPSIKYVLDVHRDSVIRANGEKLCPVAEYEDVEAAQMMIVVGSGSNGLKHDNWHGNFTLAAKLQDRLVADYGNVMRPLNLRDGRFNQQLSTGMLLLEVGSCGNTLRQAIYSARLFAKVYGDIILENMG